MKITRKPNKPKLTIGPIVYSYFILGNTRYRVLDFTEGKKGKWDLEVKIVMVCSAFERPNQTKQRSFKMDYPIKPSYSRFITIG